MKKTTKRKAIAIAKYSGMWVATIGVGFLCWVCLYFYTIPCDLCEPRTYYVMGLLAGIAGTICYFMVFSLLTPVVRWVWGKIRCKPQSFIKLIK